MSLTSFSESGTYYESIMWGRDNCFGLYGQKALWAKAWTMRRNQPCKDFKKKLRKRQAREREVGRSLWIPRQKIKAKPTISECVARWAWGWSGELEDRSYSEYKGNLVCAFKLLLIFSAKKNPLGFPGGAVVKNLPANAGDTGLSPGPGRSHMPRSNEAHAPQLLSLHA